MCDGAKTNAYENNRIRVNVRALGSYDPMHPYRPLPIDYFSLNLKSDHQSSCSPKSPHSSFLQ